MPYGSAVRQMSYRPFSKIMRTLLLGGGRPSKGTGHPTPKDVYKLLGVRGPTPKDGDADLSEIPQSQFQSSLSSVVSPPLHSYQR